MLKCSDRAKTTILKDKIEMKNNVNNKMDTNNKTDKNLYTKIF